MLQGGKGRPDGGEGEEHDIFPFGKVSFLRFNSSNDQPYGEEDEEHDIFPFGEFDLSNPQPYGEEYEEHEEKQEGDGDQLGELDRVEVLKEGGGGVVALAEMGLLQHHL